MDLEQVGHDAVSDRDLYMVAVDQIDELAPSFRLPSRHFACLIVGDTRHFSDGDIHRFALKLLQSGAIYLCTCGPGCERAHDLVGDAILMSESQPSEETVIPTAALNEDLGEALYFLLSRTGVAPAYEQSCHAALIILVGAGELRVRVRDALRDTKVFVAGLLEAESAA